MSYEIVIVLLFISGTYGVVFKAIDIESGRNVALKRIRLEK